MHIHIAPELLTHYTAKVPNLWVSLHVTQLFNRHATLPSVAVANQDIHVLAMAVANQNIRVQVMAKAASVHHDTIAIRGCV